MKKPKILLINPPIHDFTAYDFWLKPYGLLSIAGYLRGTSQMHLFDYLDRLNPSMPTQTKPRSDKWGRGSFYSQIIKKPPCLDDIPRHFRRFGMPREIFINFLKDNAPFDFALVQTMMTYWYPGILEVIEDIRNISPNTKIVLGGNYATICTDHAKTLGADLVLAGLNLDPLWQILDIKPDLHQPSLWEAYKKINVGALKLTQGCPFKCTYCSVPMVYGKFTTRPLRRSFDELNLLCGLGAKQIAFYDDALLFKPQDAIIPFLQHVINQKIKVNFHTPNALNARFLTEELALLMVQAGFKTFNLGLESISENWHQQTGAKVFSEEFTQAVKHLTAAGAEPKNITAYQIIGHPKTSIPHLEETIHFVHALGIRGMLADFSAIPQTPDGQYSKKWINIKEPLMHNKTVLPIIIMGKNEVNRLKELQRTLNNNLQ